MTGITSRGRLLISVGADGRTIVYDYGSQELLGEIELKEAGIGAVHELIVMEDENTLVLADQKGLHPIDLEQSVQAERC